jgi:hypothetical protein
MVDYGSEPTCFILPEESRTDIKGFFIVDYTHITSLEVLSSQDVKVSITFNPSTENLHGLVERYFLKKSKNCFFTQTNIKALGIKHLMRKEKC